MSYGLKINCPCALRHGGICSGKFDSAACAAKLNNLVLFLIITGLVLPALCVGQSGTVGPPDTIEGLKFTLWKAVKFFPEIVIKVTGDIFNWLKSIWNTYIYPFLHKIWLEISSVFGNEVERRKPVIEEELKKETQEMKQEVPQVGQSLWQKLKDFLKLK